MYPSSAEDDCVVHYVDMYLYIIRCIDVLVVLIIQQMDDPEEVPEQVEQAEMVITL